ncbi:hypothetical protein [Phaeodactylibacter xiamenensis]|uniref:hypothetical protein n=1 Tax=Phaeodactylibacter xiamenensis TaxID=1524460 RepID=UPI003CCBAB4A
MTDQCIRDLERGFDNLDKMPACELYDLITELLYLPGLKEQSGMVTNKTYLVTALIADLTAKAILTAHYEGIQYEEKRRAREEISKNR